MTGYGSVWQDALRVMTALVFILGLAGGCSRPGGSTDVSRSAATGEATGSTVSDADHPVAADSTSADETAVGTVLASAESADENVVDVSGKGSSEAAGGDSSKDAAEPGAIDVSGNMSAVESTESGLTSTEINPAEGQSSPGPTVTDNSSERPAKLPPREPLFVDWPKPRLALVITGRQYGYMEPCGCSGLENQNGGLVRRCTLIKQLKEKGWPVIPIDAGNQVRRFGRQAVIKFQFTVRGLSRMGYRAIAFGPDDLRLPADELVGQIVNVEVEPNPFVAANVTVEDPMFTSPYLVLEEGGKKIGVTAVLGERNQKMINSGEITLRPAEEGIREVWPKLQQARCDLYVLIAHATTEESIELGRKFPQFKVVITTGGAGEPTIQPDVIQGTDSQLVEVGTKGMFAGVVALFDDADKPLRYQRIPLDSRFPDSKEMLQVLADYQDQLKEAGFDGLGIRPQPLPGGGTFIGSDACEDCHEDEYNIWKKGLGENEARHAHAYATLQNPPKRSKIPRNFDPECVSCHVIGWNPQKYYPYNSGYWSLEKTPKLINVGCEDCHGPGAEHTAAENGDVELEEDEIQALRKQQVLELKDAEKKCLECHDLDNSPAFQEEGAFDRYWAKIKHGGEEKDKKDKKDKKNRKKRSKISG